MTQHRDRGDVMNTVPKWGPRLARLYGEDIKRLEAKHADKLSPGTCTWEQSVEALFKRVVKAGPRKGVKLLKTAADYLNGINEDERAHLMIGCGGKGRSGHLAFATFGYGAHPDPAVQEEGLSITLHIVHCSRSRPRCGIGIPVAFISRHAMNRLFERGHDITENAHASSVFAYIAALGYITHRSEKHVGGGLHLRFSGLLMAGHVHRFSETCPDGRSITEAVYDVRTVLEIDRLGDSQYRMLDQGEIAAGVVLEWFENANNLDERQLAERIPALPRREDTYPARAAATVG